jgi:hypothetical protein
MDWIFAFHTVDWVIIVCMSMAVGTSLGVFVSWLLGLFFDGEC